MRRSVFALLVLAAVFLSSHPQAQAQTPHILRSPSLSDTTIAFRCADDIWTVPRDGGVARRLTSTAGVTDGPYFSPDGSTIAYSARVGGNTDVYTIPVAGGAPHRITFHPAGNNVRGWTPDGRELLVASMQDAVRMYFQLYRVHADGSGLPERLPLPNAYAGSFSADGVHFAYNPFLQWQGASWKRYRGGQTQPVWIVELKTLSLTKVPRDNSNDTNPVWHRRCRLLPFRPQWSCLALPL